MRYIYVIHNNEWSDSEDFGAVNNEKTAIDIIKDLNKKFFSDDMERDHSLVLRPYKCFDDDATSFELFDPNDKNKYKSAKYDYEKLPLNNAKAIKQRAKLDF